MLNKPALPRVAVVIPSYNPNPQLFSRLYDSLQHQRLSDFEVLVVDDASSDAAAYDCIDNPRFRIIKQPVNQGPAACRNLGAAQATAPYLFFTDTDCELTPETLEAAVERLEQDAIVIGNTITRVQTRLGRAIALLGFPGGGAIGFDKVWRVGPDGYTNSFSSCNLAFRKDMFEALGCFDASFPVAGGEDTVLAYQATQRGIPIRYASDMIVYHVEKSDYAGFVRWQLTRGRGNYHIKRRIRNVGGYLKLRLWTFKNSLIAAGPGYALPVLLLILVSVYYQIKGMRLEQKHWETSQVKKVD